MVRDVSIHITEAAIAHFCALIDKEPEPNLGLRLFLDRPRHPKAEVGISFCPQSESLPSDIRKQVAGFMLYIDAESAPFLDEANIDFQQDDIGGQLAITAPNIHGKKPAIDASLSERIQHVLNSEVNPQLAHHGGHVILVEVTEDGLALLEFQGGCQGCGMADMTLKQGIEQKLLSTFEELSGVRDATDHAQGTAPYFPTVASEECAADTKTGV
ncbi:MAG: NifU family protein [Pseudomonadota bacterium]